jgi:hypothetical protein
VFDWIAHPARRRRRRLRGGLTAADAEAAGRTVPMTATVLTATTAGNRRVRPGYLVFVLEGPKNSISAMATWFFAEAWWADSMVKRTAVT